MPCRSIAAPASHTSGRLTRRPELGSDRRSAGRLLAVCASVVLAACGGGDGSDASDVSPIPVSTPTQSGSPATPSPAPTPPSTSAPATDPSSDRLRTLWPIEALRYDVKTNRVASAHGFDLGNRYLWIVHTTQSVDGYAVGRWTAVSSTDLTTFTQQDIVMDGIAAGTPTGTTSTVNAPHKVVRFGGRFHGIPLYAGREHGPAAFYSSDDALDWRSPNPLMIGGTRYSFRETDIARHCPYAYNAGNECGKPYDLAANDTTLMLRLYDRILSTRDLVNWTAAMLPPDCFGFTGIGTLPGRAVIAAQRSTQSCVSEDNGLTWRVVTPTLDTRGITLDGYGFKPGAPSVAGGRFVSTGGYVYRPYWFTSTDGLHWTLQTGPKPAPACAGNSPINSDILYTGTRWVDVNTVCESPGTAVSLSVSDDGSLWNRNPLPSGNATALLVSYYEQGTANGSIAKNALVVRGTDDVLVFGQPSVTAPFGLMRVRF
jgi:hypothetical protein